MWAALCALDPLAVIIAVGPNPALQRVLQFDAPVIYGGVHRATSVDEYVGGKGQGTALALQRWAPEETHVCAAFFGGDAGQFCEKALRTAGLELITSNTRSKTRTCTTLLAPAPEAAGGAAGAAAGATELIDPSGTVSAAEVQTLTQASLSLSLFPPCPHFCPYSKVCCAPILLINTIRCVLLYLTTRRSSRAPRRRLRSPSAARSRQAPSTSTRESRSVCA